jgi:hypothetical protein
VVEGESLQSVKNNRPSLVEHWCHFSSDGRAQVGKVNNRRRRMNEHTITVPILHERLGEDQRGTYGVEKLQGMESEVQKCRHS